MSLIARHFEANGIPSVVLGSARDIVEQCGVSRFLFTDFPLGNPVGRPDDPQMQKSILKMALELLPTASFARTTIQAPYQWDEDGEWRKTYMQLPVEPLSA